VVVGWFIFTLGSGNSHFSFHFTRHRCAKTYGVLAYFKDGERVGLNVNDVEAIVDLVNGKPVIGP
jgi:hypothetical protein